MKYTIGLITLILGGSIIGYLFGSILFAVVISKLFDLNDIYKHGSKNPGYTNSTRLYGRKIGILILILDILKTVLPILISFLIYFFVFKSEFDLHANQYFNPAVFIYIPGVFAVIGHSFPVFHKFKGGKGISCLGGLYLSISPFIALIGILIILLFIKTKRIMSIGTITAALILPFIIFVPGIAYLYLIYPSILESVQISINNPVIVLPIFSALVLLAGFVLIRHKENIRNLRNKNENKI